MYWVIANGERYGFERGDSIVVEHPHYLEKLIGRIDYDFTALGIVGEYRTVIFNWREFANGLKSGLIKVKLFNSDAKFKQQFKPRTDLSLENRLELYEAYFRAKDIDEDEIRQAVKEAYCHDCGRPYSEGVHGLRVLGTGWNEPPEYYCEPERYEE